jgi:hypothetical protein
MEQLRKADIPISTSVNLLFAKAGAKFRIRSLDAAHPEWADQVTVVLAATR